MYPLRLSVELRITSKGPLQMSSCVSLLAHSGRAMLVSLPWTHQTLFWKRALHVPFPLSWMPPLNPYLGLCIQSPSRITLTDVPRLPTPSPDQGQNACLRLRLNQNIRECPTFLPPPPYEQASSKNDSVTEMRELQKTELLWGTVWRKDSKPRG